MKSIVIAIACVITGAAAGYIVAQLGTIPAQPALVSQAEQRIEFSDAQIDQLAERLAPKITDRLGKDSQPLASAAAAPTPVADEREQEAAFTRATQIVDQMIANRNVTNEGLIAAGEVLRQSGQVDRSHEVFARVAAAVNRRELTPEQAGWRLSEQ